MLTSISLTFKPGICKLVATEYFINALNIKPGDMNESAPPVFVGLLPILENVEIIFSNARILLNDFSNLIRNFLT